MVIKNALFVSARNHIKKLWKWHQNELQNHSKSIQNRFWNGLAVWSYFLHWKWSNMTPTWNLFFLTIFTFWCFWWELDPFCLSFFTFWWFWWQVAPNFTHWPGNLLKFTRFIEIYLRTLIFLHYFDNVLCTFSCDRTRMYGARLVSRERTLGYERMKPMGRRCREAC